MTKRHIVSEINPFHATNEISVSVMLTTSLCTDDIQKCQ